MSRFLSASRAGIKPYVPGEQPRGEKLIKLNTNEAPYAPPQSVIDALSGASLNLYCDPLGLELRQALAEYHGVAPEHISLGNGSDDNLALLYTSFFDTAAPIAFPDVTYGLYPVLAALYNVPFTEIPLRNDLTVNVDDYVNAPQNVILANPNAPTGIALPISEIERIVVANPDRLVVIDEAYADFWGESAIPLTMKYGNIIVVRTYSKSRFLAGARLGYVVAPAELIGDIEAVRFSINPYNVTSPTLLAGREALRNNEYFHVRWTEIAATRDRTISALRERGFEATDSKSNFIFAKYPKIHGPELLQKLRARGILVRNLGPDRIRPWLRITVGTPEQMDALLAAIDAVIDN